MFLNKEAARVHKLNENWWKDLETGEPIERNLGEMLMLCISELAEALEGYRKSSQDAHLPHRRMAEVECADYLIRVLDMFGGLKWRFMDTAPIIPKIPENFPEALLIIVGMTYSTYHMFSMLPDHACISLDLAVTFLLALADKHELDIWGAYEEKLEYNRKRADHKIDERKKAGGKKF